MATVTRSGVLDMQVCCPAEWTDEQIVEFANRIRLAQLTDGLSHGKAIPYWLAIKNVHHASVGLQAQFM